MSEIWENLIDIQDFLIQEFDKTGVRVEEPGMEKFNNEKWVNIVWNSDDYRRAHIDTVDARDSKGLWMMHCCIFPHVTNDGPIYGFDVIAGKKKITGAFHDFSPSCNNDHDMIKYFSQEVEKYDWKKERELPEWARRIFSNHMVAAGNINSIEELEKLKTLIENNTKYYLNNIGFYNDTSDKNVTIEAQNNYAYYQKQNPHTPRTMKALGLDEKDVEDFIGKCLFPEIKR